MLNIEKKKDIKGFFTCNSCKACKSSSNCKKIKLNDELPLFEINRFVNCNTEFAIYALRCPCEKIYIGSTIKACKKRILEHMRAIKNNDQQYPVARHFHEQHKNNANLLKFVVLDQIPLNVRAGDRTRELRRKESRLIIKYNTICPTGLNQDYEMSVHL